MLESVVEDWSQKKADGKFGDMVDIFPQVPSAGRSSGKRFLAFAPVLILVGRMGIRSPWRPLR